MKKINKCECGGVGRLIQTEHGCLTVSIVLCSDCDMDSGVHQTENFAIEQWNEMNPVPELEIADEQRDKFLESASKFVACNVCPISSLCDVPDDDHKDGFDRTTECHKFLRRVFGLEG